MTANHRLPKTAYDEETRGRPSGRWRNNRTGRYLTATIALAADHALPPLAS
jgi:hypothetical protein